MKIKNELLRLVEYEKYIREKLTDSLHPPVFWINNKDIRDVPDYIANFSKSLKHDQEGRVDKEQFKMLMKGITGQPKYLKKLELVGPQKLVSPSCIYNIELFGPAKSTIPLPPAPKFTSAETAGEMVELYEMALLRDVPFSDYNESNPAIISAINDLNQLSDFKGPKIQEQVTASTLFRGNTVGDLKGPYVSQFLYHPFKYGICDIDQKCRFPQKGINYLTTYQQLLNNQNGQAPVPQDPPESQYRYLQTLRDGAAYVKVDLPCQAPMNAAMILMTSKVPFAKENPYVKGTIKNESPFVDFGMVDIYDLINRVSRLTFLICWYHKWSNMKLRPEALGLEVEKAISSNNNKYCIHPDLLNSNVLSNIFNSQHSYLLSQTYPEGSPAHPSYPAGHAAITGAAVTVLKAFFDCDQEIDAVVPSSDGQRLIPLGYKLNINDELDKLASNIAIFRNAAGCHYRSDAIGVEMGEMIGIKFLEDMIKRYNMKDVTFRIRKRNGKHITISN